MVKPLPWQVYNLPLEAEEDDVIGRACRRTSVARTIWTGVYTRKETISE